MLDNSRPPPSFWRCRKALFYEAEFAVQVAATIHDRCGDTVGMISLLKERTAVMEGVGSVSLCQIDGTLKRERLKNVIPSRRLLFFCNALSI